MECKSFSQDFFPELFLTMQSTLRLRLWPWLSAFGESSGRKTHTAPHGPCFLSPPCFAPDLGLAFVHFLSFLGCGWQLPVSPQCHLPQGHLLPGKSLCYLHLIWLNQTLPQPSPWKIKAHITDRWKTSHLSKAFRVLCLCSVSSFARPICH